MGREALLSMLKEAQGAEGYLSKDAMHQMAAALGVPVAHVYGVATFYAFLSLELQGRHVIRLCKSVPCFFQEGESLQGVIEGELGIGAGETTPDGRFTLELTNCIGACDRAPAMLVDDEVYGELTPEKVKEILQSYD
ncbi:MAG: NADH-quinone oxidoreductase subunit NuoE [Deltaproteobacteria bacterium]|nr:NADH-quinone oxidoreductase subunit NuoE [Deltaproteobacteria bacterium]